MDVALYVKDFVDDPNSSMHQQVEDVADVARRAGPWGFMGLYAPQHWVSYPSVWMQPLPLLARLAPEAPGLKLITGVALLPMLNPVELAEQVVTLDHISNGNFVLGTGIGYREVELEAVGATRSQRVCPFRGVPGADEAALVRRRGQLRGRLLAGARRQDGPPAPPGPPSSHLDRRPEPGSMSPGRLQGRLMPAGPPAGVDRRGAHGRILLGSPQGEGNSLRVGCWAPRGS